MCWSNKDCDKDRKSRENQEQANNKKQKHEDIRSGCGCPSCEDRPQCPKNDSRTKK